MRLLPFLALTSLVLVSCAPEASTPPEEAPIRGLITEEVRATEETLVQRYPSVLEPADITALSFKVSGKLRDIDLQVGQAVKADALLAELDDAAYRNDVDDKKAALDEAVALLEREEDTLSRQQTLFERNVVSRVTVTDAETDVRSRRAQVTQAEKALATAQEDFEDTKLYAPYAGLINSVEVDSFQTVAVGDPVVSIYDPGDFEVSFSVNFDTVNRLVVGTRATVRLADDPTTALNAVVSELGERADTVSSFPVVIRLTDTVPFLKAGMAVEVALEFPLPANSGFLIPLSAAINEGQIPPHKPGEPVPVSVFVFDPNSSSVRRREVIMAGIRENKLVVIEGLAAGEQIAIAGVSFLRDGMQVKLAERKF